VAGATDLLWTHPRYRFSNSLTPRASPPWVASLPTWLRSVQARS